MNIFLPRNITSQEHVFLEKKFEQNFSDPLEREAVWYKLKSFFDKAGPQMMKQYQYSFFRYYVYLNWKNFQRLSLEEIERAFRYEIPLALAMNFDPIDELLYWLNDQAYVSKGAIVGFKKVKEAFLTSDGYFGRRQGKDYFLKEVFSEMGVGPAPDKTTVDRAKLYGELVEMVKVPRELEDVLIRYPVIEESEIIDRFAEVVNLFEDTPEEEVPDLLLHFEHDSWFHEKIPNWFVEQVREEKAGEVSPLVKSVASEGLPDSTPKPSKPKIVTKLPPAVTTPVPGSTPEPQKVFLDEISAHKDDFASWIGGDAARESLVSWMKKLNDPVIARVQLVAALKEHVVVDAEHMGNATAIVELDAYLGEQGFGGKDFLYFDAETGGFEWNEV